MCSMLELGIKLSVSLLYDHRVMNASPPHISYLSGLLGRKEKALTSEPSVLWIG